MYSILEQSCENSKKRPRRENPSVCENGSRREHQKCNKVPCRQKRNECSDSIDGRTVTEILQEKHPKASPLFEGTFNIIELPSLEKQNITSSTVEKQARKLFGVSGPSGSDANHWFDALIRFGLESSRLRDLVSQLDNLIANEIISWRKIKALFSCRLIALDKQPGVRPIGIAETSRRLLGKAVADLTGDDLAYAF